jgi:hypothetical protein
VTQPPLEFPESAVWIGSAHPFDLHEAYLCFRSPANWRLERPPAQAELFITADSRYKLWVNGQFVARGPARSYPETQSVDRLDVTPYLQAGFNTLAVQVYQPGYSHFAYVHRAAAGLLAHLVCDGQSVLATHTNWLTRRDPSFTALVPRVSIYGSGVEDRDLNLADNWTDPHGLYDDTAWAAARLVAPVGGYPWTDLRLRSLPLLAEREIPLTLLETRLLTFSPPRLLASPDPHLALREGWFAAAPQADPVQDSGWFRAGLNSGEAFYWLFDLGRDFAGQGWVEIEGAGGQEQLAVSYAEKIRDGQLVLSDPQTYCRVRLTDRFRLRPGSQEAETFALRGGRYLLFQLAGPTGPDFRLRFHARVAEYPLEITRPLTIQDPLLSGIMTMCETTFHACLQDGFVDSTWRESSQWVGDALPQGLIMAAMSDDVRPLRQVIEMAALGTYPDGVLPSVLPGEVHAYAIVDYNFIWVELLHLYQKLTDDNEFVGQMWPTLVKMLDRFQQDLNPNGLLMSQPGRRLFLDWAPLARNEPSAVYNLHYVLALQRASQLANTLALVTDEAAMWQARFIALQAAIRATFWEQGRWYDDVARSTFSQLAAALAVLTQTSPPDEHPALLEAIAARSLDLGDEPVPDKMVLASPFMHHYLFEALRQGGRSDQVIEIIRLRWGRWVQAGYPTTWENWNVDFPDGSQCHAFSAHPRYHLAEIAREQGGIL